MKDWTAIAKAIAPDLPVKEVARIADPLNSLEAAFRPLVKSLTADMEPAALFRPGEEGQ